MSALDGRRRSVRRAAGTIARVLAEAIGNLLPAALAVALTPLPIVAVVLVLGAPNARAAGPAFAFGWVAGLILVSVAVLLLVGTGDDPDGDDAGLNWFKAGIGVLFLLMAALVLVVAAAIGATLAEPREAGRPGP